MARVNINVSGMDKFIKEQVGAELERAARVLAQRAGELAPKDTGQLSNSMRTEMRSSQKHRFGVSAKIIADAPHSGYQNQGTGPQHVDPYGRPNPRPNYVPRFEPLVSWGKRKGVQFIVIADAIAERGTKPKLFMKEAAEEVFRRFPRLFNNRVR